MSDATILVQITDPHLGSPGAHAHGFDTAANLARVFDSVATMAPSPDAILITGDLSDRGDLASYEHLRKLVDLHLGNLDVPILVGIGNHDDRASFRRGFLGEDATDVSVPHLTTIDLAHVRVVMCDSHLPGAIAGRLGHDQLEWLDHQLTTAGDRACVVAVHHPSVPRGIPKRDDYLLEDRQAFAEVISAHDVAVVLCGHSHVPTAASFAGTLHVSAPSAGFSMDPFSYSGSQRGDLVGYAICTIREGRAIVNTHMLAPEAR